MGGSVTTTTFEIVVATNRPLTCGNAGSGAVLVGSKRPNSAGIPQEKARRTVRADSAHRRKPVTPARESSRGQEHLRRKDAPLGPPGLRLFGDFTQDRCPARLGLGARRDAPTLRLPTGVIGVALSWPAVSSGTARGEAQKGFVLLEVAVPSLLTTHPVQH